MKKFFLICVCALMGWNLSAQVAQTFVPNPDEIYFIKCQNESKGKRTTHFLTESLNTPNDTLGNPLIEALALSLIEMSDAEAFDYRNSYAGWKVTYVQDKGYMIQNKGDQSGNYLKYIGSYHPDPTDAAKYAHIDNGICSAPLNEAEIGRYYFQFRPAKTPYEIGNDENKFHIQGYSIIAVGTENVKTQALDAYAKTSADLGTWDAKADTGTADDDVNQFWFFMTQGDFPLWRAGIEAAKIPFSPVDNQVYYIKNIENSRGFKTRYLMQNADSLIFKTMNEQNVKNQDAYKWYLEVNKETAVYRIKNKATGQYIKFNGDAGTGNKHGLVKMGEIDENRSDLTFEKTRSKVVVGIEGFDGVPSFSKQPYYVGFNFQPGQGLNGADTEINADMDVRVTTWNNGHTDPVVNWIFMTDQDVDDYTAAANDGRFILEEGDVYYTFRPENLSGTQPEEMKNTRIADADDGSLILSVYDLEDESAQWKFMPIAGTDKYYIKNRFTENYLTIGKWSFPTGSREEKEALARTYVTTAPLGDNLKQQLSIVFSKYVKDEYGRASKVFGIANKNVFPDALNGEESKTFYLDHMALYTVGETPGVYSGGATPGGNQLFIIRTLERDQAPNSMKQTSVAKSSVSFEGKTITVISSEANCLISVYTINGALVKQTTEKQFSLTNPGFYIVKVNTETFKVVIR